MKLFLFALVLSGLRPWLNDVMPCVADEASAVSLQAMAVAADAPVVKSPCVIVRNAPCARVGSMRRPYVKTLTRTDARAFAVAVGNPSDDGRSESAVVWVSDDEVEPEDGRAWLGISIGDVPAALAAQLDIEGRGILVENVVEDSPADQAGFQIYDVIVAVGRDRVQGDTGRAMELIKAHKPGDTVDVVVLRNGREKTLPVTLGSRAEMNKPLRLKFRGSPDAQIEEHVRTRGKILRKGKDDEWIVENLGDLDELEGLPKGFLKLVPEEGKVSTNIYVHDDEKKIKTKVDRDGSTMVIVQKDEGPITVKRVDKDGEETENTYRNADELRRADKEAYKIWKKANHSIVISVDNLDIDGIEVPDIEVPDFEYSFDVDKLKEHAKEWEEEMQEWGHQWEEKAEQWQDQMEKWGEQWEKRMEQWKERHGLPDDVEIPPLPTFRHKDGRSELPPFMPLRHLAKPRHAFEVRSDGTIEVRIRKGDSQLTRLYDDEDDLARRAPELYEKYRDLMGTEQE